MPCPPRRPRFLLLPLPCSPAISSFYFRCCFLDVASPHRRNELLGLGMGTFGQGLDLGMGLGGVLMGSVATQVGFPAMYLCGSGCAGGALAIFL